MTCVAYRDWKPHRKTQERLEQCCEIISSYQIRGLRMTLRQLYYRLVKGNLIANNDKEYGKLSTLLTNARMAGIVDWDAIEDRIREPAIPFCVPSLEARVNSVVQTYRLDRWEGQENYAELWVEKDAISNILEPIAQDYHAVLQVNRGYSSASAMYAAAQRFIAATENGQTPILFYVGDLDPSGEDMVRDVRDRLAGFDAEVEVRKLCLNFGHVQEFDLPPNPAKLTDNRAAKYIATYGESSWEVDALDPPVLDSIIRAAFASVVDEDVLQDVLDQEESDKTRLRSALSGIGGAA